MTQNNFYIRIPHQFPPTIGKVTGTEDKDFYSDSHLTLLFDNLQQIKEFGKHYKGHQWIKVKVLIDQFLEL